MSDEREKTRSELLNELESIQGLLDHDEIPLLQEVIEQIEHRDEQTSAVGQREENYELDLGDAPAHTSTTAKPGPAAARGENPFLPQHIRSRLRGNRAGDFATEANNLKYTERQQLIDEVIIDLLPQLKATLRTKLSALTDSELHALKSPED
ncbi:hypothetical protein [Gilvimarinus agarilyticus]|uniref:hypothetical protein n=1 Tax=Gilvimarinus agarilyticus TaxID=679259 RepID=UPI0005A0AA8C|nr:hypothetical protein [Gilvimarinus agarilyticus]